MNHKTNQARQPSPAQRGTVGTGSGRARSGATSKATNDPGQRTSEVHDLTAGTHARPVHRADDGHAFLPDPFGTPTDDAPGEDDAAGDLAEDLGEEFVTAATGNVDVGEQMLTNVSESENGGPYTTSSGAEEFADDVDENNPPGATREPFPTPMRGDALPAPQRR